MSVVREAVAMAQRVAGNQVMELFSIDELDPSDMATPEDFGYFGPQSVVWRVHGDQSSLIGGFRALFMESLHVRAMHLFGQHTVVQDDPLGRLQRTSQFVVVATYGSTAAADRMIATIRAVHSRVTGFDQNGNPISADDPDLLTWVHNTLVDGFLDAYERYGNGKLTDAEKDQYVAEWALIGRKLGGENVPESVAELRQAMVDIEPELAPNKLGRDSAYFLLRPPDMPLPVLAGYSIVTAAAISSLPRKAQLMLRMPVLPGFERAVRPAAKALARTLGWVIEGADHTRERFEMSPA